MLGFWCRRKVRSGFSGFWFGVRERRWEAILTCSQGGATEESARREEWEENRRNRSPVKKILGFLFQSLFVSGERREEWESGMRGWGGWWEGEMLARVGFGFGVVDGSGEEG